jgi:hypothetical protein
MTIENLKKLLKELGAEETTSDGFTFIELDSTSYKYPGPRPISKQNKGLIHRRNKLQATGTSDKQQAK